MADETSSSEEKPEMDSVTETTTVKKKVAKKKSAKKKVAKKKATTKKKVAAKKKVAVKTVSSETAAETPVSSSKGTAEPPSQLAPSAAKAEAKPATPTAVATASAAAAKPGASADSKPTRLNVTVQTEMKKDTTSEDISMTTESKSASGFWLKVTFWLVIIILGFMYIRSLAINPKSEATTTAVDQEVVEQEVVETTTTAELSVTGEAAGEEDASGADDGTETIVETTQQDDLQSVYSSTVPEQEGAVVESAPVDVVEQTADTEEASDAVSTAEESVTATAPTVEEPLAATGDDAAASESKVTPSTSDQVQAMRDMHAESVSKILKEFDDLRNATRAEIEAMRNRIQAERELREAMSSPPPWSGRGYTPYSGYPPPPQQGYSPYPNYQE
jgi:hypothetical protein